DVVDLDALVFADAREVEQAAVDGAGALVVELGVGDGGAVDLGFQQGQERRGEPQAAGAPGLECTFYPRIPAAPGHRGFTPRPRKAAIQRPRGPAARPNSRLSIRRVRPRRAATSATRRPSSPAGPSGGSASSGVRTTA